MVKASPAAPSQQEPAARKASASSSASSSYLNQTPIKSTSDAPVADSPQVRAMLDCLSDADVDELLKRLCTLQQPSESDRLTMQVIP